MSVGRSTWMVVVAALAGCATTAGVEGPVKNLAIPVRDPSLASTPDDDDAREDPPDADPARAFAPPTVARSHLPNGAELVVAPLRGSPLVEVRVVLPAAGSSADGERVGLAVTTAALVTRGGAGKIGPREVPARFGQLGSALVASVSQDATTLAVSVARDRLAEALDLVALVLREPRLDPADLAREKRLLRAERGAAARGDAAWIGAMVLHRELFKLPASTHPYAPFDATAADVERVPAGDVKAFHRLRYTPSGASIVMVGELDPAEARAAAERAFGPWRGSDPPALSFTAPVVGEATRMVLADIPGAPGSEIFVGAVTTERADETYAALLVASDILGGSTSSRIPTALREHTALAGAARATLGELARGPVTWVVHARAEGPRTGAVVKAMLDELRRLDGAAPPEAELAVARRRVVDALSLRLEAPRDVAAALASAAALRLSDDALEKLVTQLRGLDGAGLLRALRLHPLTASVIVVVGDASKVGPALARLGEVAVVLPERGFERARTLAAEKDPPAEPAPVGNGGPR